ncbi:uncharacterized protein LOC100679506 [Nasonia vitripennis]|uniref:THAP-type domain-containing protein n=1 Tax=Nasonia vitripennis TaxID=7425 RepID=A0A7M7GDN8_NASVI|nr:uncharacterized protein LOC100679506 [Nasonia vitripennis]
MNENPKKRQRVKRCCVIGCTNENSSEEVPYYYFPTDSTEWKKLRRQKWIDEVVQHNKQKYWEPKKNTMICAAHFTGGRKSEHPQHPAFNPTIFPGQSSKNIEEQVTRFDGQMKQEQVKPLPVKLPTITTEEAVDNLTGMLVKPSVIITKESTTTSPAKDENVQIAIPEPLFSKIEDTKVDQNKSMAIDDQAHTILDFQCQVNISNAKHVDITMPDYMMCNLRVENNLKCAETQINLKNPTPVIIKSQKETLSYSTIFKTPWLQPVEFNGISSINFDSDLEEISGVNFAIFNQLLKKLPAMERLTISNANRLLIFLMKFKQGLSTSVLSILFHLNSSTIDRIIDETLEQLAVSLKSHVYWPKDRQAMTNIMPNSFKDEYINFRAIIDCIEIHIEVPTNVKARIEFYTKYKTGHSFKIFFAFAPNGFITYKSKCYGEQKRDVLVANDCGFLNLISDNDVILAIKDFPNLKTVLERKNAVFVTPPFMENSTEYTIYARILNSINQIKLFRILSSMPTNLASKIDDVVQVCSALNNLRLPL